MKYIFFDLDGTLLPMDQDVFAETYMKLLAKKMAEYGYDPHTLIKAVWSGMQVMVQNDGSLTNEQQFWNVFSNMIGERVYEDQPLFEAFYKNEFQQVKHACGFNPEAKNTIEKLKEQYHLVLATNPLFPRIATESRVRWAGLSEDDFELITTYETNRYCKPNVSYYLEICEKLNIDPKDVLMVGNDVSEDMIAETIGMDVFLLTDCLINSQEKDISAYPQGSFQELLSYLNLN